jgi:hypothetical protein
MGAPEDIDFMGCHPLITAETLERLAHDLKLLAWGRRPTPEELAEAPVLRSWAFDRRPRPCLRGVIYGHPDIREGRETITSEIYALDPERRWVRTLSRLYELGPATLQGM